MQQRHARLMVPCFPCRRIPELLIREAGVLRCTELSDTIIVHGVYTMMTFAVW